MKYVAVLAVWLIVAALVFLISGFICGTFDMALMEESIKVTSVTFGLLGASIVSGMILEK